MRSGYTDGEKIYNNAAGVHKRQLRKNENRTQVFMEANFLTII